MNIPFENSFASHEKCIFWSKKNIKQPREVSNNSSSKYWFDCICGHEFESTPSSIRSNRWCGFCCNPPQKLCDNKECSTCLNKSFASNTKHIFWNKKNIKQPREIFKNSRSKYLFDCICGHVFECALYHITGNNRWCGFCAKPSKILCDNENCKICLDKSFASNTKHIFWSKKNIKQPREMFKSSNKKFLFVCENMHEFESTLANITNNNSWCPKCQSKTETKLYEKMVQLFPSIITQFKQEWCKNINNNYYLPFDLCIPENNIIIELDGRQHFIQVLHWSSPEINFENDKYKEKCANENCYSTIRIIQEDVLYDKYDWCKELCETIEHIKNGNKVINIYLCKKNEYDKYK